MATEAHHDVTLHSDHPELDTEGQHIDRVVFVCIEEKSGHSVLNWAVKQFIRPESDLVVLIHVRPIDIPSAPYMNTTSSGQEVPDIRREESHKMLREFAHELVSKKITCKAVSMIGDPKSEIVRKVIETKADVLIMGSRQLGAIKRAFLGSVSDYCAHNCPCTVVIAKTADTVESEEA
ncbi:hypothetical protein J3Q64DRAFT_1747318 [Phycomyces blakesleeanus]|uniref:UspA domain-containing protein n=2 Tax=Phycomyces blakesleeanus TaxID=4837 RepID=A0A163DMX1_PHYB8|nr:hypothetical protein PHYBLDRAFT_159150 [Phycomyces blakesleeanus NRRL 1555(-)]OAD72430.1 hypothetical protein PHYBLDRAFT_159150 [Phycomyces blakesleeanus NRRL 1555(-)]|eukprot:XP_018290470.1 hypothetical protein PHYBLDRAFT_159150 [Phycomyces blakesleeanus NRRL 1555(-)]